MKKILNWLALGLVGLLAAGGLTLGVAAPASATNNNVTCSTAWLEPHRALVNGDHINIEIVRDNETFQVNAYVDQNIEGGANVNGMKGAGLRVTAPGGSQVTLPLTAAQVESGRLTFDFGKYIAGSYAVTWVQFNDSYFNPTRNPDKVLECGTKFATAEIVTTPATCEAAGTAEWVNVKYATTRPLDQSPGTHQGIATATANYSFKVTGQKQLTVPYLIEAQLDPNTPPCYTEPPVTVVIPATPTVSAVIGACVDETWTVSEPTISFPAVEGGRYSVNGEDYFLGGGEPVPFPQGSELTVSFRTAEGNYSLGEAEGWRVENGTAYLTLTRPAAPAAEECSVVTPPETPPAKITYGEWSVPVIDCYNAVGDELGIAREVYATPYVWDAETSTFVLDETNRETVVVRDVYIVTEADIEALECAVVTPPTEEPPVVTPPTEEPPVVTPPVEPEEPVTPVVTETPQVAPAPVASPTPEAKVLAATGAAPLNPWVPTLGALALALGALSVLAGFLRRRTTQ